MTHADIRLCAIIDASASRLEEPDRTALDLIAQGCTALIYRAGPSFRTALSDVSAVVTAIEGRGALCLVIERVDLASCAGCGGVVLRQTDMHPRDARELLGPEATIGLMVGSPAEADELYRLPVDFALVGEPADEPAVQPAPDLEFLGRLAFRAHLAAPGIGVVAGPRIGSSAVPHLIGAGADGVAAPAGVVLAGVPRSLRAGIDAALASRGTR